MTIGICSTAKCCSAYKSGKCLGCDVEYCIIKVTDEEDILREFNFKEFDERDERDY